MLTDSQKRALRAKSMLDAGGYGTPKQIARELGYTSVNGMLVAIAMVDGLYEKAPAAAQTSSLTLEQDGPRIKATMYPVEDGFIWIRRPDISISYRTESDVGPTVHINNELHRRRTGKTKWFALVGKDIGGREALASMLRQLADVANECAALIEDEMKGGK